MNAADLVRVHRAGQAAARAGEPATACPYKVDADTPQEQALARMWIRGYDKVNPLEIDYSG